MTSKKQRTELATLMGWHDISEFAGYHGQSFLQGTLNPDIRFPFYQTLPEYQANKEAIQVVKLAHLTTREEKNRYRDELMAIMRRDGIPECGTSWVCVTEMCFATAEQEAEAVLRTLDLWKGE